MGIVATLLRRRAIRSYALRLPALLKRDYGAARSYTPAQVRGTIARSGLNDHYSCYALSMFSDRSEFDAYHRGVGEQCDYDALRETVAETHFHGNPHFTVSDVFALSAIDAHEAGGADFHGGGGHHGGHSH